MIHTTSFSASFGKIVFFPVGVTPDNTKYLKCGTHHLKSAYFPKLYNAFPFNLAKLSKNNFPNMTSNSEPSPYSCVASSEGSHHSSASGTRVYSAWRAFNSDNASMGTGHVGSHWRATAAPSWIQFNMPELYYVERYSIYSYDTTMEPHTCTLLGENNDILATYTFDKTSSQNTVFPLSTFTSIPAKTIRWTWNTVASIYYITINTVTRQEYIDKTDIFEIPAHEAPQGYIAYVYIGVDNPIDLFSELCDNPYVTLKT